jgi:hypothetical protein
MGNNSGETMKKLTRTLLSLALLILITPIAHAEVVILEQNGWKVGMGGFVEFDTIYDNTRSFLETAGNAAVARKGTFSGDNGRTQFSLRNSRLSFNVQVPETEGWKSRGFLEADFLGYDPNPASANFPANSESAFYSNPTNRIRQALITAESGSTQVLIGQTWSLFAWQPMFVLSSISVNPVDGSSYQRTARVAAIETFKLNDQNDLQAAASIERPSQRDGSIPNAVLGLRWMDHARTSGFTGPNSDIKVFPLSVGISGTYRNFEHASNAATSTSTNSNLPAFALAANVLLPIISSSDGKDTANTLTASGEFTAGRGYGDEFTSWTGGLSQTYADVGATATTTNTNIDPGLGGYNQSGEFDLVKLRTFNAQLQYHFIGKSFATLGYGQLYSSNISEFVGAPGVKSAAIYDRIEVKFINFGHDFTEHLRMALEFDHFNTHYVSDDSTHFDNRYILATYLRF